MIEAILRRFCRLAGKKLPRWQREKVKKYPDISSRFQACPEHSRRVQCSMSPLPTLNFEPLNFERTSAPGPEYFDRELTGRVGVSAPDAIFVPGPGKLDRSLNQ